MDEFTVQGHQENNQNCSQQSSSADVKQKSEIAMDLTKYFFFLFQVLNVEDLYSQDTCSLQKQNPICTHCSFANILFWI